MAQTKIKATQIDTDNDDDISSDAEVNAKIHAILGNPTQNGNTLQKLEDRINELSLGSVSWSSVQNKPTTYEGYGLTPPTYINESLYLKWANSGAPWGVSPLDGNSKVPKMYLPQKDVFKPTSLSSTSTIPQDTSIPLINEGTQILTFTKTPSYVDSKANIHGSLQVMTSTASRNFILVLFKNNTAIAVAISNPVGATKVETFSFNFLDTGFGSNPIAPVTYSLRMGLNTSGTWYLNKTNTANLFSNLLENNCVTFEEL